MSYCIYKNARFCSNDYLTHGLDLVRSFVRQVITQLLLCWCCWPAKRKLHGTRRAAVDRYTSACCDLDFWSQKLISTSTNTNTSVTKIGWNSIYWVVKCGVYKLLVIVCCDLDVWTFDLISMSQVPIHTSPNFGETSSNNYEVIVFTVFPGQCLLWPWTLTFWSQNLISTSTNPNTSVTKIEWSSLNFLIYGVYKDFETHRRTHSHAHSRTDRPEPSVPPVPFFNGGKGIKIKHLERDIHRMTMTSFAITLCGHCCRRHVVGQPFLSDIDVVRSFWSICSLYSESNNTYLSLRLLIAVYFERPFWFTYQIGYTLPYNMAACGWWSQI